MTVTNGYATLAQLRSHLGYDTSEVGDDTKLELAINAASRQIDNFCGWRFWQDATVQAREFAVCDQYELDLMEGDPGDGISTVTGLIVKVDYDLNGAFETTLTSGTDFLLKPRNAATRTPVWPYTALAIITSTTSYFPLGSYGRCGVQITAKWGWPAVPDDITQACLIQAAQLAEARHAVFGAIALGETAARNVASSLNPIAKSLVSPYQKPPVG